MTSTEQLIEAVVYADENDIEWFHIFDTKSEAMKVIKSALRETPDEGQIVCLLSARDADEDMFESYTAEYAYKQSLQEMRRELQENA